MNAALDALGIDLEGSLLEEPRFLADAAFLGALHAELRDSLGAGGAAAVLLQLGFARGLFDAGRLVREIGASSPRPGGLPVLTRLPMRLAPAPARDGGIAFAGSWPEHHEAEAVLAALGGTDEPACHASAGYTSGWLSGVFAVDAVAVETRCCAAGARTCRFAALEASTWRRRRGAAARRAAALPFLQLHELVARRVAALPQPARMDGFERGSPAIHVWGPVMVVPFAGADESLRALELIARDRDARGVRVVIVDLAGAIIDQGFGALALERILDAVAGLGAEPILAGVSPLSAGVVAELERAHALVRKDLPEAIAAGFQIAQAQRAAG
ncbi:MAG TPA: V4R domain-containing protein [Myxococcota bacterium]|nr:V4R domain-containing protein [Myxococcota bacterium]